MLVRRSAVMGLVTALVLALSACGGPASSGDTKSSGADTPSATPSVGGSSAADGPEAMPTDGPGESAAVAALPNALNQAKQMREGAGMQWPNLSKAQPRFTAYILAAEMNGQVALFEVRSDGIAHSLYAYQQAFDAGTIIWTPVAQSTSVRSAPQSAAEKSASAAVEAAMKDAFPDNSVVVTIYGYRFVYLDGNTQLLILEVAPDGSVISAGS